MREPYEIEVTGLLEYATAETVDPALMLMLEAVNRAHQDERTTWLTIDGMRCAAIVPLEMGRVMDTEELPLPVGATGTIRPEIKVVTSPPS